MRSLVRHLGLLACTLGGLTALSGCTDDDDPGEGTPPVEIDCGPNGELHVDHCHCDPGFKPSANGMTCEPEGMRPPPPDMTPPDAMVDMGMQDDMSPPDDMGMPGDAAPIDQPPLDFNAMSVRAGTGAADDGTQVWQLEAMAGETRLRIEIYEAFGGPTAPGVVPFTDTEASYATCGTCLLVETGCMAHGDHFHCDRVFMPRAMGELQLSAIGTMDDARLAGELRGVVLQEVTIDQEYRTEPVANGATYRLDWSFDAAIEMPEPECSGHGHLHGDHCHCDPGYRTDPQDSRRCIPQ